MGVFDIEPYRAEVKPMFISPRMDTRNKKQLDVVSKYNKVSKQVSDDVYDLSAKQQKSQKKGDDDVANKLMRVKNRAPEQSDVDGKRIRGLRSMSKIYDGLSFLPQDVLARADQIKSKANYERVKDDNYIYFADVIKSSFIEDEEKKKLEEEIFEDSFFHMAEELPGQGSTAPHNLNIFHGIGTNPVKKKDKKNFQIFQKNPYYKALHDSSMTPRNIIEKLSPGFWAEVNKGIDHIASVEREDLPVSHMEDLKNPYGEYTDNTLNWIDAPDPYSDNKVDSFDIKANFHTIITSQAWQNWDSSETFKFVNRLWEARSRVDDVLRELVGKAKYFPTVTFNSKAEQDDDLKLKMEIDETLAEDSTGPDIVFDVKSMDDFEGVELDDEDLDEDVVSDDLRLALNNDLKEDSLLANVQQWWDTIGESLNEAEVLPFGLLTNMVPLMQTMMDWGNWGEEIAHSSQLVQQMEDKDEEKVLQKPVSFKESMIHGYLNYATDSFFRTQFMGDRKLNADQFSHYDEDARNHVMSMLVSRGLITANGTLTDAYQPDNPDFKLDIAVSMEEERHVEEVLREASIGSFSLTYHDNTKVNLRKRENIRVKSSDGVFRSLPELLDLMMEGKTSYERVTNSLVVYDTLFDMHAVMTDLNSNQSTNGRLASGDNERDIKVKVSETAQWREWDVQEDKTAILGEWVSKEGDYSMTFRSSEEADAFKTQIRGMIALLEPIVGTFSPDIKNQEDHPVRVLVDNAGSMEKVEMITDNHEDYRIEIDHLFNKHYFKTDSWKQVASFLSDRVFDTIKHGIFSRTTFNRIYRMNHKRKIKQYQKNKQEHEDKEVQRVIQELRRYFKTRATRKKAEKKSIQAIRKRHQEMMVAIKRQKLADKKRTKTNKKSSRKSS